MKKLELSVPFQRASVLNTSQSGSELITEICQKVDATEYLSGRDGKNYLKVESFLALGIKLDFQNFIHPVYSQMHGEFIPAMSVVDLLFNHGPKSIQKYGAINEKS
jgi:hypothetical protein